MWKVFPEAASNSLSSSPTSSTSKMAKQNFTFNAQEASTFSVDQSLDTCKALFQQSWKSYDNEHYHLMWKDNLEIAIQACKG